MKETVDEMLLVMECVVVGASLREREREREENEGDIEHGGWS